MAFAHGRHTVIKVASDDISTFTNTSEFPREVDTHDVTCYGADDYAYSSGLRKGSFKMGGTYDDGASGTPQVIFSDNEGDTFAITRQPLGTGTGKPQQAFNAILTNYTETNPVAGMIAWSAEFTRTGPVTTTTQS